MDFGAILLTGIGLATAAGLNAYIPLLIVGVAGRMDWIALDGPYTILSSTPALVILTVLLAVEFFADKVPAVDSINDVVQTVIRPLAGAGLFAAAFSDFDQWAQALALIAGLTTAGTVHAAKSAARPVVNVSTAGVGGPVVSFVEDVTSLLITLAALIAPILVLIVLVAMAWGFLRWRKRRKARAAVAQ